MATSSTPFVHVTVNRFGFNILDVRINLVGTDSPKAVAAMLVLVTAGISPDDAECAEWMDWVEKQYINELEAQSKCAVPSEYVLKPFRVNDDLVSFRYEIVYD